MEDFLLVKHFSFLPSFLESYGIKSSFYYTYTYFLLKESSLEPRP